MTDPIIQQHRYVKLYSNNEELLITKYCAAGYKCHYIQSHTNNVSTERDNNNNDWCNPPAWDEIPDDYDYIGNYENDVGGYVCRTCLNSVHNACKIRAVKYNETCLDLVEMEEQEEGERNAFICLKCHGENLGLTEESEKKKKRKRDEHDVVNGNNSSKGCINIDESPKKKKKKKRRKPIENENIDNQGSSSLACTNSDRKETPKKKAKKDCKRCKNNKPCKKHKRGSNEKRNDDMDDILQQIESMKSQLNSLDDIYKLPSYSTNNNIDGSSDEDTHEEKNKNLDINYSADDDTDKENKNYSHPPKQVSINHEKNYTGKVEVDNTNIHGAKTINTKSTTVINCKRCRMGKPCHKNHNPIQTLPSSQSSTSISHLFKIFIKTKDSNNYVKLADKLNPHRPNTYNEKFRSVWDSLGKKERLELNRREKKYYAQMIVRGTKCKS